MASVDPVDYEAYAHVATHRKAPAGDEVAQREFQVISKARTRDMRVLLSLRAKTAQVSKGKTTGNVVESSMRQRAEDAAHAASELHVWNLKRRLAAHAYDTFARADENVSGDLDFDEWVEAFGQNSANNPLFDAGPIDVSILRALFDELDFDHDGKVSIHEFVTGTKEQVAPRKTDSPADKFSFKQSLDKAEKASPAPLESPMQRYRRINRPAAMGAADLMKSMAELRAPKANTSLSSDDDGIRGGGGGSFFGSLGMDTGAMEVEELQKQICNVFELFDDDESGFLDFQEVRDGLERFGMTMPKAELVDLLEKVGAGTSMECNAAQFEQLLSLVKTPDTPPPPPPRLEDGEQILEDEDSLSSSSSSSSSEDDESEVEDHDDIRFELPPTPPKPRIQRLRSPRSTQVFHDDALQSRLKGLESNLKKLIHTSKATKDEAFNADVQTGKITYIAAEMSHAGALYSGPINASGMPAGVGALDYRKVGDARGRLKAERRAYYVGTIVDGKRQGFGLLRWMDRTEFCGSWLADVPDGSGVETYEDGSWYAGGFKEDKRNGMGGIWSADGLVYMGQWQKGVRHGSGIIAHADSVHVDLRGQGQTEEVSPCHFSTWSF